MSGPSAVVPRKRTVADLSQKGRICPHHRNEGGMLYVVLGGGDFVLGKKVEPGLLSIRRLLSGMEEGRGQVSDKPLSPLSPSGPGVQQGPAQSGGGGAKNFYPIRGTTSFTGYFLSTLFAFAEIWSDIL